MSKYIVDIHGEIEGDYEIVGKYEEPTTKNDLADAEMIRLVRESDVIDRTNGSVLAKAFNYLFDKYIENPTTKNDLAVDAVSRKAVLDLIADYDLSMGQVVRGIHALPSVTPQEPITWIVGKNNAKIAVKNMPIDKLQKICAIIGDEQEPILDKIREEIKVMTSNRGFLSCSVGYIHKEIDNVFDKYKAESEDKE